MWIVFIDFLSLPEANRAGSYLPVLQESSRTDFRISLILSESETFFFSDERNKTYRLNDKNVQVLTESMSFCQLEALAQKHSNLAKSFLWIDGLNKQIHITRDAFGKQPVFYYFLPGKFLIVSDSIREILRLTDELNLKLEPDRQTLANYLLYIDFGAIYSDQTFFREIKTILPGNITSFSDNSSETSAYLTISEVEDTPEMSDHEIGLRFKGLFRKSVKENIENASKIGGQLSGGLDSSSVLSMVRFLKPDDPIYSFFTDGSAAVPQEELPHHDKFYAAEVARELGLENVVITPGLEHLDAAVWLIERVMRPPMITGSLTALRSQLDLVSQTGCDVLLTGFDGDSVVGYGRNYILELYKLKDWRQMEKSLRDLAVSLLPSEKTQFSHSILPDFFINRLKEAIYKRSFSDFIKVLQTAQKEFNIDPKKLIWKIFYLSLQKIRLLKKDWPKELAILPDTSLNVSESRSPAFVKHYKELLCVINVRIVEEYHAASEDFHFQVRHPFYNTALFEFCQSVPLKAVYNEGKGRGPLREGLKGILPEVVRQRTIKTIGRGRRLPKYALELYDQCAQYLEPDKPVWKFANRENFEFNVRRLRQSKIKDRFLNLTASLICRTIYTAIWLDIFLNRKQS